MVSTIPLVSFVITLLLASAVSIQGVQVNDTHGNPVKVNELYYIQPVTGGSLYPGRSSSSNPSCPLGIFQLLVEPLGDPVSFAFTWPVPPETIVDTYSDVTIEFNTVKGCNGFSKYWGVDVSPPDPKQPEIIVGAEPTRTNSWFQIRTAGENTYELATRSGTVGVFENPILPPIGRAGQLVLINDTAKYPFVKTLFVKFIKKGYLDATRTEKLGLRMFPFY